MYDPCKTCTALKCNVCTMQLKKFKQPQRDDIIVLKPDPEMDLDLTTMIYDVLKNEFPENKILIAYGCDILKNMNKEDLQWYSDQFNELLS